MTLRSYSFDESLALGQSYEQALDVFLKPLFSLTPAISAMQKRGVDRVAVSRKTKKEYWLEYKADTVAGRTGNAFLETMSVQSEKAEKLGWLYTSAADYIVYFVVDQAMLYWLSPAVLRRCLPEWQAQYKTKDTTTAQGWRTTGLIVPLEVLAEVAEYRMEYRP